MRTLPRRSAPVLLTVNNAPLSNPFLAIVAQTHQLFARLRQIAGKAAQFAQSLIIGATRLVHADQHLIGCR